MSEKKDKVVPPKGKKTTTSMLIDPALTGGYRRVRRRSALDDEFEAEDEMQARELRDLRMEEITTKRKARIAKLKRDIEAIEESPAEAKPSEGPKIPGISITVARQIAALPDEERERVLETYVLMQAAEAKHANAVLPAIVGFARANPGSSQNQMVEYAKLANEQLKTGIDLARGTEAKQQQIDPWKGMEMMRDMAKESKSEAADPWKPVELVMDLVKESVREPLVKMSERMQPQPSPFEAILMDDRLFNRAKELGVFGGRREGGSGTSDMDLKIEELRTERDLGLKKLDLEWRKVMLEREAQDKRTDAVLTALAPLSAIIAGPINQRMRQFGQQQAAANVQPGVMPPPGNTILIRCSCGYQGPMTFQGPPPDTINCPSCGQTLVVGGAPGASGNPEETDTGT